MIADYMKYMNPTFEVEKKDNLARDKHMYKMIAYVTYMMMSITTFLISFLTSALLVHVGYVNDNSVYTGIGGLSLVFSSISLLFFGYALYVRRNDINVLKDSLFEVIDKKTDGHTVIQPSDANSKVNIPMYTPPNDDPFYHSSTSSFEMPGDYSSFL